jgi:hypothetical protein
MTDRTLEWRVEEVCLNAWPALREVFLGGWLLRFSEGFTRRANSANALGAVACIYPSDCEALYRRLEQPAIFRVLTLLDPSTDEQLARRGYTAEGETCVLYGDLDAVEAAIRKSNCSWSRASNGSLQWRDCRNTRTNRPGLIGRLSAGLRFRPRSLPSQ